MPTSRTIGLDTSVAQQPGVKVRLHSAGDASPLAALLLPQIFPIFSVVAPCHRGASPASVRRRDFHHGLPTTNSTKKENISFFVRFVRFVF